ncbi:hypothetical protein V1264_011677 [Littorina saxatilis]|uniref:Uncharacterized protein n=2 Tax=Littorina saxatilis TaxID=31220 RepID=A0AAN9GKJ5_9CAEN
MASTSSATNNTFDQFVGPQNKPAESSSDIRAQNEPLHTQNTTTHSVTSAFLKEILTETPTESRSQIQNTATHRVTGAFRKGMMTDTRTESSSQIQNTTAQGDTDVDMLPKEVTTTYPGCCNSKNKTLYLELLHALTYENGHLVPPNAGCPDRPVDITVTMTVEAIENLDMQAQTFSLRVWVNIRWYDTSLAWDTTHYPFRNVLVPASSVWRPSVAIANSVLPSDQLIRSSMAIKVTADGLVRWYPGGSFQVSCKVDITLYPFDTQTCFLVLVQWSGNKEDVNGTAGGMGHRVQGNGEWDVLRTETKRVSAQGAESNYWKLHFSLTMKRKWVFYALHVLLPIALVSVLNSAVLALPVQCGERMSVTVTTFLTLAVFVTLVHDTLPKNSDTVCYLSVYLAVQMGLGAVAVVLSTAVVTHHHKCRDAHRSTGEDLIAASDKTLNTTDQGFNEMSQNRKKPGGRQACFVEKGIFLLFALLNGLSFVLFVVAVVGQDSG